MENKPKYIVGEASKTWTTSTPVDDLLGRKFEYLINTNLNRGYHLVDWKISSSMNADVLTETIIAVFELKELT